jgi:hypothetical protein
MVSIEKSELNLIKKKIDIEKKNMRKLIEIMTEEK